MSILRIDRNGLTRVHVMEQLGRLLRVHKKPAHAPADLGEFADDYIRVCRELTNEQFTGAIDTYLAGPGRWCAKPGELLALGRAVARGATELAGLPGRYAAWERDAWQDPATGKWTPCPVCGERMQERVVRIAPDGSEICRMMLLHNAAAHWKADIGFSGLALPGTGGGKFEHQVVDQRPAPLTDDAAERAAIQTEDA